MSIRTRQRHRDREDTLLESQTAPTIGEIQENVKARVVMKQDAKATLSVVSEFVATHEAVLRPDEQALFQRVTILLQRIGW